MNGILMKPENIELTVKGLKTQTRRTDGLKEINKEPDAWIKLPGHSDMKIWLFDSAEKRIEVKSRYHPDEIVYLKEGIKWTGKTPSEGYVAYTSDDSQVYFSSNQKAYWIWENRHSLSPMFLPERYARYFIKILSVRPERLLDISLYDCIREGIRFEDDRFWFNEYPFNTAKGAYFALWDFINGKDSYKLNPWVWVYDYQPIDKSEILSKGI